MSYLLWKRVLDFTGATLGILLFSPLIVLTALAVVISSGRPIFFIQSRPGFQGKPFFIVKFRTMRSSTSALQPKSKNDLVTPIGKFLRASSLDELPQLFNILKGEMSFIGQRPLLHEYVKHYTPEQARRMNVRPGLTGLAQVSGRNLLNWDEKFSFDQHYVDNVSFRLDISVLVRTVPLVFRREGVSDMNGRFVEPYGLDEPEKTIEPEKLESKDAGREGV